jgi:hypothetical protein
MATSSDFVRAWQEGLRVETPIENSRQRRFEAPTYKVEVALDHLDSSLYSLGLAVIDGRDLDFAKRLRKNSQNLTASATRLRPSF